MGLVWNSMMSMAGGWFFLMITETYQLGEKDFRLPGVGSYMKVAVDEGRVDAMLWAMLAMLLMIVALDQLMWRPIVVWAQKFRVEEGGEAPVMSSWFLNWLRRSRLLRWTQRIMSRLFHKDRPTVAMDKKPIKPTPTANGSNWGTAVSIAAFAILLLLLAFGAWKLTKLLAEVPAKDWGAHLPGGRRYARSRVGVDGRWHAVGAACRIGNRLVAAAVPHLSADRAGRRVVSGADVISAGHRRLGIGGHLAGLGLCRAHALGNAVVHSV